MHGIFLEQQADPHVQFRATLLGGCASLSRPCPLVIRTACTAELLARDGDMLLDRLAEVGLLVLQLKEPLADEDFLKFGSFLGDILPETDPTVQPHVDSRVILNLVSVHSHTTDVSLQPFAINSISLHTESSGRPIVHQPRYVVLMCLDPGEATAAQTVLVPMESVEQRLSHEAVEVLAQTRYLRTEGSPQLVRRTGNRWVFSFRDFVEQELEWIYDGDDVTEAGVNGAIRDLLAGMYSARDAKGVHWIRGLIVVIDNTFYFHGRTSATSAVGVQPRRHLKRLRILKP